MTKHITCEFCTSIFRVEYNKEEIEDEPGFCPFCGDKIFLDEEIEFEEDIFEKEDVNSEDVDL